MAKNYETNKSIHPSIKQALGYKAEQSEREVFDDWNKRKSRVCKPCWELKYCPYGPLVEQSPCLPPLLDGMEEQIEYFKRCLSTNLVGSVETLTPELKLQYEEWLADDQVLLSQAVYQLEQEEALAEASKHPTDIEKINAWMGDLPPIHVYRTEYEELERQILEEDFEPERWNQIVALAQNLREKYQAALKADSIDNRHPLEPARAAWFRARVERFNPDNHPNEIPDTFTEAECNVFGHICPVFFAAEALTETKDTRRIGRRAVSFATMMRIVRRDDYRCQHCKKRLQDDEVEFDHIIPVSKGGSSEEHNLRLTCFDCNGTVGNLV